MCLYSANVIYYSQWNLNTYSFINSTQANNVIIEFYFNTGDGIANAF